MISCFTGGGPTTWANSVSDVKKTAQKLKTDDRGGMPDMRTPYSRMPLKNDVAIGEAVPSPRSHDPLGFFPREYRAPKPSKKQTSKRKALRKRIKLLERKLKKLHAKAEAI